jgi:hypothetical protein
MMDVKISETFANVLSFIGAVPSFDGALLFSGDIADILGFQIKCKTNSEGRLRFFVFPQEGEGPNKFCELYKRIYDKPVRSVKKYNTDRPHYPTAGSDRLFDVSPATIAKMIRLRLNESEELECVFPAFVMRLAKEAQNWENQFLKLYHRNKLIREKTEEIFEDCF